MIIFMLKQTNNKIISKSEKGFTLLEVIFVIAILSAITVLGLAAYKQKVMNTKIDKTALQMQIWLQAGMQYYVNKNQWPSTITDLVSSGYLPPGTGSVPDPGIANNPWGNPALGNAIYSISTTQNGYLFQVETTIPSYAGDSPQEVAAIAQQIAAKLPMASVSGDTVTASVNVPGMSSNNESQYIIRDIKILSLNDPNIPPPTIVKPTDCPAGYDPDLKLAVNSFQPPLYQNSTSMLRSLYTCNDPNPNDPTSTKGRCDQNLPSETMNLAHSPVQITDSGTSWTPTLDIYSYKKSDPTNKDRDWGIGKVVAIIGCKKQDTHASANASSATSGYAF